MAKVRKQYNMIHHQHTHKIHGKDGSVISEQQQQQQQQ